MKAAKKRERLFDYIKRQTHRDNHRAKKHLT